MSSASDPDPGGVAGVAAEWHTAADAVGAWYRRAREAQFAHYDAADRYGAYGRWFGVPVVVLSALVGTSVFASLDTHVSSGAKIAVGMVSILAAVLSALQTFLGFSERSDKHRSAAASYGAVRRAIEQRQVLPPESRADVEAFMAAIRAQLDDIAGTMPDVPPRSWERAQRAIAHTERPEGFRANE